VFYESVSDAQSVSVIVYRLGESAQAPSSDTFHTNGILEEKQLDPARASEVVRLLSARTTFSDSHVACVGAAGTAFGLRLHRQNVRLDLLVDVECLHLFDAASGEELAFLSDEGRNRLRDLYLAGMQDP
jgi:hypothetical protein